MPRLGFAVISDFKVDNILSNKKEIRVGTPYGPTRKMILSESEDYAIVFLARREIEDEVLLGKYNYCANIWGLNKIGIKRIISLNNYRALEKKYAIGDIVIPNNLIDYANNLYQSFFDKLLITPVDLSEPFCSDLRNCLIKSSKSIPNKVWNKSIIACMGMHRFETTTERKLLTVQGCNLTNIGMSPEIFLSRELKMCYCSFGIVCSKSIALNETGIEESIKIEEALNASKQILKKCFTKIPKEKGCSCSISE